MAANVYCFLYINSNKHIGYIKRLVTFGDILVLWSENVDMLNYCGRFFQDY
ncbi:hypothetical protein ES703_102947 [subsurface metagenome]